METSNFKNFVFSCSHCSCTIFVFISYSLFQQKEKSVQPSKDCLLLLQKHKNMEMKQKLTTPFKTKSFKTIEIWCKEKKKHPDTKSISEYLEKNDTTDILENQVGEHLNQIINLNLIFSKKMKMDLGLDSFYKTT